MKLSIPAFFFLGLISGGLVQAQELPDISGTYSLKGRLGEDEALRSSSVTFTRQEDGSYGVLRVEHGEGAEGRLAGTATAGAAGATPEDGVLLKVAFKREKGAANRLEELLGDGLAEGEDIAGAYLIGGNKIRGIVKLPAGEGEDAGGGTLREQGELTRRDDGRPLFPYDFTVTTLDGRTLSLKDLAGKVVILDFWGTWCIPCRKEIPHLVELKEKLGDKVEIVGMTYEGGETDAETQDRLREFAKGMHINYPLTLITEKEMEQVPDFGGFPTLLMIDPQGRVRLREQGLVPTETLEAEVERLLGETGETAEAAEAAETEHDS